MSKSSNSKIIEDRYKKIDVSLITDNAEKNKYLKEYPSSKNQIIYILRPGLQEFILDKVNTAFVATGYTMDDKAKDEKEVIPDKKDIELPNVFKVKMEFTLKNNTFSVVVDKSELKHTDKSIPVSIDIMPYFLATYTKDSGYMLLPDGSGSLIHLNNGKTNASLYTARIYGQDPVAPEVITEEKTEIARMPIFGVKTKDWGAFARISGADADAIVKADISGKTSMVNNVYASFKLRDVKKEVVYRDWKAGAGTVYANRLQTGMLSGEIKTDYVLLDPEKADYSNMAYIYRKILESEKVLVRNEKSNTNMLINILGSVDSTESIAGVPVKVNNPMTTYSQAEEVSKILKGQGVSHDINYIGAFNGGYKQSIQDSIRFQAELGGKGDFARLNESVKANGTDLYLDTSLPFVTVNKLFDSFIITRDTCMNISRKYVKSYDVDPVSFYNVEFPKNVLTSAKIKEIASKLSQSAVKFDVYGISIRGIANVVATDYNPDSPVFRSQSVVDYQAAMSAFRNKNIKLLFSGGNEYAFKYANRLSNISSSSNQYRITDESIPFYQMVVHGYIPYSYAPVNLQSDPKEIVLASVSTGAQLSATISYKDTSLLKKTEYSNYYGANWNSSKNIIIDLYKKTEKFNSIVNDRVIEKYEYIADSVTKTNFEGNISVIVNFGEKEYTYKTIKIPPRDFAIETGD
jgi:hypothetical protein